MSCGAHSAGSVQCRTRLTDRRGDRGARLLRGRRQRGAAIAGEAGGHEPHQLVGPASAHHDRRAVLTRYRDDLRLRVARLHQVAERRDEQMVHRRRIFAALRRRAGDTLVLGAIDALVRARDRRVEIIIGDDARVRRVVAGQDRRMAGAGFGRAMRLIARREDDTRREPRETAGEAAAIFGKKVGRELVDRDHHHQLRGRRRGRNLLHRRRRILREAGSRGETKRGGKGSGQIFQRHGRLLQPRGVSAGCPLDESRLYGKPSNDQQLRTGHEFAE